MIRRVLWVLGGLGWGGVSTLIGLYATFPADAARDRIEYEFHRATNKEMALDIGDLSLWRMSGADLSDVQVYTVKRGRKTKDEPKPAMQRTQVLHFDRLAVRAALLPTLMGKKAVAFAAEIYDGTLDGTWSVSDRAIEVAFDVSDVDLTKMPAEGDAMALNLLGTVKGTCDLVLDTEDVKGSSGSLRLDFPGIGLAKGSKIAGFELPEVVFDKAVVAGEVQEGKLEITEGAFESSVITATLSGDIALNKKLGRSRNRLELTFTLPADIDSLAQMAPDLKRARDAEGTYHFLVTGTVLSPNARPSKTGRMSPRDMGDGEGPGLGRGGGALGGGGEFGSDLTDEERKAKREKRIQERRERLRKRREEAAKNGEDVSTNGAVKDRDMPRERGDLDGNEGPSGMPDDLPPGIDELPPGIDDNGQQQGPDDEGGGGDEPFLE